MTWNDITIGKFIEITEVLGEDLEDFEKTLRMVGIATGKNIKQINIEEAKALMNDFQKLNFEDMPYEIVTSWRNYRITNRVENVTAYQMSKILELSNKMDEKNVSKLHMVVALLSRPKVRWFQRRPEETEETLKQRAKLFYDEMPITIAFGNWVFFWKVFAALNSDTKLFSKAMRRLKKASPTDLLNTGGGI